MGRADSNRKTPMATVLKSDSAECRVPGTVTGDGKVRVDIISASLRSRLAPARNTGDERPASAAPPQAPALRAAQVPGTRERTRMRTAVPPGKQRRAPGRWNADANRGRGARESRTAAAATHAGAATRTRLAGVTSSRRSQGVRAHSHPAAPSRPQRQNHRGKQVVIIKDREQK